MYKNKNKIFKCVNNYYTIILDYMFKNEYNL